MRCPTTLLWVLSLTVGQIPPAQALDEKKGQAPKNDITIVEPPGLNLATLKEIVGGADFVNPTLSGEALKTAATVAMGLLWDPVGKMITHTELCASARGALTGPPQEGGQHLFSYTVNLKSSFGDGVTASYTQTYMAFVADGRIYYTPITTLRDGQIVYGKPEPCTKFKGDDKLSSWKTAVQATPFETLHGKITVYLPDDIRAGDTISGTVMMSPTGATDADSASSRARLGGFVIDTGENRVRVDQGNLLLTIEAGGGLVPIILRNPEGETIAMSGSNAALSTAPAGPPRTVGAVSPAAQPLSIPGKFDGNAENTRVTINGQPTNVIAESPRQTVVRCPPGTTGPVDIVVSDPQGSTLAKTNLVGIKLSAPRLNLVRGEKTTVTVEIMGLQGLRGPLSVNLTASPNVKLEGGNSQTIKVDPSKADATGAVRRQFNLLSRVPGPFEVNGDLLPRQSSN